MQFGPDQVIACPTCGGLAKFFTIFMCLSRDPLRARLWTDGKMRPPMLPETPPITKCYWCGSYFWLSDAKVVGNLSPDADVEREKAPLAWRAAPQVEPLAESECLEALVISMAGTRDQEIYLRIRAWHTGNDPLRARGDLDPKLMATVRKRASDLPPDRRAAELLYLKDLRRQVKDDAKRHRLLAGANRSKEAVGNLVRLAELLDTGDPSQRLMRAEVLRELGRFAEAMTLLREKFPDGYSARAVHLRRLIRKKDTVVHEVPGRGWPLALRRLVCDQESADLLCQRRGRDRA